MFDYLKASLFAGAAVLAIASTTAATAADLGPYRAYSPPPAAEVPEFETHVLPALWDGAYAGLNGGYGWADASANEPEGMFGGGQIGYNWQRDRLVFGVEADIQASDIDDEARFNFANGFADAATDINWFSTLRGRVGISSGPALFYATAGLAFADIDHDVRVNSGGTAINFSSSKIDTGYVVGGGVEWSLSERWTAKAEYLYLDFGDQALSAIGSDNATYRTNIDTDMHTARLGLNYKF